MITGKLNRAVSPGRISWLRFRKDIAGMSCLILIGLISIIASLGYLITGDPTRDADRQHLELSTLPPGTSIDFVVSKTDSDPHTSWTGQWLYGTSDRSVWTPVTELQRENGHFTGKQILNFRFHQTRPADWSPDSVSVVRKKFLLGTDRFGRDVLSRLVIGARVSLIVGAIAVLISVFVGIVLGAFAGFFRGWIDDVISWMINVVWSVPTLLFVIAVSLMLGKGLIAVFIAVGLTMWVDVARVVRGQFLSYREKEFVEAGRALGFRSTRIIFRHILPNIIGPILVIASSNFASALLIESGLSFLGYGVQPPVPTWGNMIETNRNFLITEYYYLALIPGIAIMFLVLAFTLLGDGLRKSIDVSDQ